MLHYNSVILSLPPFPLSPPLSPLSLPLSPSLDPPPPSLTLSLTLSLPSPLSPLSLPLQSSPYLYTSLNPLLLAYLQGADVHEALRGITTAFPKTKSQPKGSAGLLGAGAQRQVLHSPTTTALTSHAQSSRQHTRQPRRSWRLKPMSYCRRVETTSFGFLIK